MYDFVQDHRFLVGTRVIRRNSDQILILTTNKCFSRCIHCCRHPAIHTPFSLFDVLRSVRGALRQDTPPTELIFSGGDPLADPETLLFILKDETVRDFIEEHHPIVRIGSRAPVLGSHVEAIATLKSVMAITGPVVFVTQINSLDELDSAGSCFEQLREIGIHTILNQSVLLSTYTQKTYAKKNYKELFLELYRIGVRPYYLYNCDPQPEFASFRYDLPEALEIYSSIVSWLPGPAVPRFVQRTQFGKIDLSRIETVNEFEHYYEVAAPARGVRCYIKIPKVGSEDVCAKLFNWPAWVIQ